MASKRDLQTLLEGATSTSEVLSRLRGETERLGIQFVTQGQPTEKRGKKWYVGYRPSENTVLAQRQAIIENFQARSSSIWGQSISIKRLENLATVMQSHEVAEAHYSKRFNISSPLFGTHASPQVIKTEMQVARQLGGETLQDVARYRKWELEGIKGLYANEMTPRRTAYLGAMPGIIDENLTAQARSRVQKGFVPGEYISKIHRVNEEMLKHGEGFHVPEQMFHDPKRYVSGPADEAWQEFLEKQSKKPFLKRLSKKQAIFGVGAAVLAGAYLLSDKDNNKISEDFQQEGLSSFLGKKAFNQLKNRLRISGRDDAYNVIEGLSHKGIASDIRKIMTEFGSGWDPVRALAKQAGLSLEKYMAQPVFKEALAGAKMVKHIKSGGFGRAELLSMKLEGQEIQLVRKRLLEQSEMPEVNWNWLQENRDMLLKEAQVQRAFQETRTPTVYRSSQDELLMEHIGGADLSELGKAGKLTEETSSIISRQLQEAADEMSRAGIYHADISPRNIMYDPIKKETAIIDWGLVDRGIDPKSSSLLEGNVREALKGAQKDALLRQEFVLGRTEVAGAREAAIAEFDAGWGSMISSSPPPSTSSIPTRVGKRNMANSEVTKPGKRNRGLEDIGLAHTMRKSHSDFGSPYQGLVGSSSKLASSAIHAQRAKSSLVLSSRDLRAAQEKMSYCAIRGGKYHTKRTKGHVKQLSRHGGGV